MAITEPIESAYCYFHGTATQIVFYPLYSNRSNFESFPTEDPENAIRKRAAKLSRESLAKLADQFKVTMRPLVLYVRRFVNRSQPRWSSLRWKSKT